MWYPWMMKPEKVTTTQRKVFDIITDMNILPDDTTLAITYNNETLATNEEILNIWLERGDWIYTQSKYFKTVDEQGVEIPGGYLIHTWQLWNGRNVENLYRQLQALYSQYNPIDNYNMVETAVDGDKEDVTEIAPSGTTTNTQYGAGVNTTGDGAILGKNTTSYQNAKSTTTPKNTLSATLDTTTFSGLHKATEHILKRSGNIGVTTSAQMITQEIELRVVDILADYVKRFFAAYCYYVG